MATRTISAAGGNWNATGSWDEVAVPTSADNVVARADGTSGNLTVNVASACRSADFAHYSNTLTLNASQTLSIGDASGGALTLVAGMTLTTNAGSVTAFVSTSTNGGAGWSITTAGKAMSGVTFNGAGGKWVLQDALNCAGFDLTLTAGSLDTQSNAVSTAQFLASNTNVRALTLGSTTWTVSSNWEITTTTNLTFSAASSTIIQTAAGTGFHGGGQTYGTVIFTGTSVTSITGSNTFGTLQWLSGGGGTLQILHTTTQTITNLLRLSGTTSNTLNITSGLAGTAASFSAGASAVVDCHNLSVQDNTPSGGAAFTAIFSKGVSNFSGWTFTVPATITQVGTATTANSGSGTSLAVTLPAGSKARDVGVIFLTTNSTSSTAPSATGWTAGTRSTDGSTDNVWYLTRAFDGTEGSSVTLTIISARTDVSCSIWRGVDYTTPIDDNQAANNSSNNTTSYTAASGTASVPGDLVMVGFAYKTTGTVAPVTNPSGEAQLALVTGQTNPSLYVGQGVQGPPGGTVTQTFTSASSNWSANASWTVLLKAALVEGQRIVTVQQAVPRASSW